MPGLLSGVPLTDEERRKNDGPPRPAVVLAVLACLMVFIYLFTPVSSHLSLPTPEDAAVRLGIVAGGSFRSDGTLNSHLSQRQTSILDSGDERLVLFLMVGAAFLCAYFLPLRLKRISLVFWTMAAVAVLYGVRAGAGLLFGHLLAYLALHPRRGVAIPVAAGLLGFATFVPRAWTPVAVLGTALAAGAAMALLYRHVLFPLLQMRRAGAWLRTLAVQSAMLFTVGGAILGGFLGEEFSVALGFLLFFWHWSRLIMYHVDYQDGLVPKEVPLGEYLAIFLSPGQVGRWSWGVETGQGYAYATNNYLAADKNRLALDGLRMWGVSLFYMVFFTQFHHLADWVFGRFGIEVYGCYTRDMVCEFAAGGKIAASSVLLTSLLDTIRWLSFWGSVVHFKVGVWRVCGYRIDPYFNRPWLATNLVIFWARFTFHYREFLVRAFYYPVFFRYFKRHPRLRILAATMAAATFGNLVWGHVSEQMFYNGLDWEGILYEIGTWPYFVLLGLGITAAEIYLLKKRRKRRPWTLDRWLPMDIFCAYATFQYFSLITIFRRSCEGTTNMDHLRLILAGFGIHL